MDTTAIINIIYCTVLASFLYYFSLQQIFIFLFFSIFSYHFFYHTAILDRNLALAPPGRATQVLLEIKSKLANWQVNKEGVEESVKKVNERVELLENQVKKVTELVNNLGTQIFEMNNNKSANEEELINNITALKTECRDYQTKLQYLVDTSHSNLATPPEYRATQPALPVGSILPWLNRIQKPSGVFTMSPDLPPPGWVFCDGQLIESGEWEGLETPHINAEKGLFLRGGPHYLCGKQEEEMLENHGHQVTGNWELRCDPFKNKMAKQNFIETLMIFFLKFS